MSAIVRGVRNTFRNGVRAVGIIVILGVVIALSVSMLIARQAVSAKISSVRASTGNTIVISPRGFFGGQGGGTPLTDTQINSLLSIPHVVSVQESLNQRLTTGTDTSLTSPITPGTLGQEFGGGGGGNGGGGGGGGFGGGGFGGGNGTGTFTLPIRVTGTNSPGTSLVGGANGGGSEKLVSGVTFTPTSNANVALIGTDMATANKLTLGSMFTAWGASIKVVGIYDAGSTFANATVLMPLASVQRLAAAPHQVTSAVLTADSVDNVAGVVTTVTNQLGSAADVTSTQSTVEAQLSPLNSVRTISTYTLIGCVIGAAIILLLSMLMIVRERRREIGVLKAIGAPNRSVMMQFVAESTTFTALGAVVGLVIGILISSPITSTLVTASNSNANGGFVRGGGGGFRGGGSGFAPPPGGGGGVGGFRIRGVNNALTQVHTAAGWSTILFAIIAALVIAALGSTVAAATITRISPAEVLRSE